MLPLDAQPPLAQVVASGEPDFLPTRAAVRDHFAPMLEAAPDVGSVALLPLAAGERCVGVLGVGFADERALSDENRGFLSALAGISSLALARAGR